MQEALGVLDQRYCPKCGKAKMRSNNADQSRVEFFCGTVYDQSALPMQMCKEEGEICKARSSAFQPSPAA
jgi:hypothetical protein